MRMSLDPKVEEIKRDAGVRATGCRKRSQEHVISHQRWSWWARLLAITTAAVAGIGGISAISSAKAGTAFAVVGGALVIVGVLARAVDEGLGASKTAEDHRLAAVRFRDAQLQYLTLSRFPPGDAEAAEGKFVQIQAQAIQAEGDSPVVEQASRERREEQERKDKEDKEGKSQVRS